MSLLRRAAAAVVAALPPNGLLLRRGRRDRPLVALTFDDGPDASTQAYLDALDALGVRATFFVLGGCCAQRPAALRDLIARGHEVASHGFSHRHFPRLDDRALRDELERTRELLPPSERARPWLRPPGGDLDPRTFALCARAGFATALWSLDSRDCRTRDPDAVAERAALAGAGDVILLHEGQPWTLAALPILVARLRAAGLEPTTLSAVAGSPQ